MFFDLLHTYSFSQRFLHSIVFFFCCLDEPVQPRYELNAADLYIPSMAFVTYILVVGYMLGLQNRFSPEILATTASSALTALLLEILVSSRSFPLVFLK
jgi:hypothetical protein